MGIIRAVLVGLLLLVFLHPVRAEPDPEKKAILIMVCSCGKPAFAVLATPEGVHVEGLVDSPKLVKACQSKERQIGDLIILRTEAYTKEACPLNI